jgi:hypothetical protein
VTTNAWHYIRYFDGSEELYGLGKDPNEWFNVANAFQYEGQKERLAKHIPQDARFKQFVRWGWWKCVIPVEGDPMLFDYQGEFGISEQTDLASENPELIASILEHLKENKITSRRVTIDLDSRNK